MRNHAAGLVAVLIVTLLPGAAPGSDVRYLAREARVFAATPARPLTAPSSRPADAIVETFLESRGSVVPDGSLVLVSDSIRAASGVTVRRFEQRLDGRSIYGVYAKAAFTARGELVHLIENLVPSLPSELPSARIAAPRALAAALRMLHPGLHEIPAAVRQSDGDAVFERTPFFHIEPQVEPVLVSGAGNDVHAGYLVQTWTEKDNDLHRTLVSGDGRVLHVESRTSSDSYNVFLIDPAKSAQAVVTGPGAGNAESPTGWLSDDKQTTIDIAGNNVHAYLDLANKGHPTKGGTPVTNGTFLAAADLEASPSTPANRQVAVQNLFYLNNVVHDVLYRHGFTEAAGNFQGDNYRLGGKANDPVEAEAQDGGGQDNANFATPPDGHRPRMQVYLWSSALPSHELVVHAPSSIARVYGARPAAFGPSLTTTGLTGDVVLANDGVLTATDACEPLVGGGVVGRLALIDRGGCTFVVKVRNAQAAGATGVVVANNVGDNETFAMGGTADDIAIPSVLVGRADGQTLRSVSGVNATMRLDSTPPPMIDGALDSDLVYHEYGHGLTWRMVGDMSGPLAGAVGEGASDALAILINGDDAVAEYSFSTSRGLRRFRYAGYPLTYGDVGGRSVHDDGEIFAAAVWRLIELARSSGVDVTRILGYFVDGLNFTPMRPAFEDMRDGMLQSAANAGGMHTCMIWDAFAQLGVGVGASGTIAPDGSVVVVEDFAKPGSCP